MKALLLLLPVLLCCSCASTGNRLTSQTHVLVSHDPATSAAFYKQALSWDAEKSYGDSWLLTSSAGEELAVLVGIPAPEDAEKGAKWLLSISRPDLDAVLENLQAAGGEVRHGPVTVSGGLRTAVVADDAGAVFQIVEGEPLLPGEEWIWHQLVTADPAAAADWYRKVLGLEIRGTDDPQRFELIDGETLYGAISVNPLEEADNQWIPVLAVDDLAVVAARVQQAGGDVVLMSEEDPAVALIGDSLNAPLLLQELEVTP